MAHSPVIRLQPRAAAGYTETAALNDICALLTTSRDAPAGQLFDIGLILARAGRSLIPLRDLDITIADTPRGRPVARAVSAGTTVTIRQEPAGPGLLVEITTAPAGDAVAVTLDGRCVHDLCPPAGHTA